MNTVAKNIKRLRTENNLTQDDLAEKLHVTRQTVSNWETGKNQPDIEILEVLASVFGTDINEIIYGNKRDEYPKYQKKYIADTIISFLLIIAMIVLRLVMIPYLKELRATTFLYIFESLLFDSISMAVIYFSIGFCVLSVFSLWFDCSLRKRLLCPAAIVCAVPVLVFPCEYLLWKLMPAQVNMAYSYFIMAEHLWLKPIVLQLLPAACGVLVFLNHNSKGKEDRS